MKTLVVSISLILSFNLLAECEIDTQIKALEDKLVEYQAAKDHAWDRYGANCFYIGVNSCWVCSTEVRMINSDNTMPVSEELCPKIKCVMADPTGITGLVSACLGIGIPILGLLGESCTDWCTKWHVQDNLIKSTNEQIANLKKTKDAVCPGTTTSTTTSSTTTTTTKTTKNTSTTRPYITATTSPDGSGTTDDSNAVKQDSSSSIVGAAGLGNAVAGSPAGTGIDNNSGSWYDKVSGMYDAVKSYGSNQKATPGTNDGALVVGAGDGKEKTDKKAPEINANNTDIFKIVTGMYQKRYYSGLIGENIKTGTATKTNIRTGGKKPVVYK
ncbi:MAG: hypothetical protein WCQ47_01585 [bacterium]